MLRPLATDTLIELTRAASGSDRDLDLALLRVGIYAPADLDPIRTLFQIAGAELRATVNGDGHRAIEVTVHGMTVGTVHHNGHLTTLRSAA